MKYNPLNCSADLFLHYQGKTEYLRNHQLPNPRTYASSKGYSFTKGQTGEFLANELLYIGYGILNGIK